MLILTWKKILTHLLNWIRRKLMSLMVLSSIDNVVFAWSVLVGSIWSSFYGAPRMCSHQVISNITKHLLCYVGMLFWLPKHFPKKKVLPYAPLVSFLSFSFWFLTNTNMFPVLFPRFKNACIKLGIFKR